MQKTRCLIAVEADLNDSNTGVVLQRRREQRGQNRRSKIGTEKEDWNQRGLAILLSIIYIEVCRRLGLNIVGSRVGVDFLIWSQSGRLEELFKEIAGHSLFAIVNGRCVEDPRSMASDLNGNSLL